MQPVTPTLESDDQDVHALRDSFTIVAAIDDPIRRRLAIVREAVRFGLGIQEYTELFTASRRQQRASRWLLEPVAARAVDWFASLSLFALLEYVGRLAILLAIASFFVELPQRLKGGENDNWRAIEAARGKVHSHERVDAIEQLARRCVDLEGLASPQSDLAGLRLDRCFTLPGEALLARLLPRAFSPRSVTLTGADLTGSRLNDARMPGARLESAKLSGANLSGADLHGAHLSGADLRHAQLFRTDLRGADLSDADLSGADLSQARLEGARLVRSRLAGARLVAAQLQGAVVQHADLADANLAASDLRGVDFFSSSLRGASLRRARFDDKTWLEAADLALADLRSATPPSGDQLRSARGWTEIKADDGGGLAAPAARVHIGLIVIDHQFFFEEIRRGAEAAAGRSADLTVRYTSETAGPPLEVEAAIVHDFIRQGFDAVVLAPQDEAGSVDIIRQAHDAGLVVACVDHCLAGAAAPRLVVGAFQSDQRALGYQSGQALARTIGQSSQPARIGIFKSCSPEGCYRRLEGFRAALDEANVDWRDAGYEDGVGTAPGEESAQALLDRHPDLRLFWSANESGTEGLVAAVRHHSGGSAVRVWGTDLSPTIRDMLRSSDGILQAVTRQNPLEMGKRATAAVLAALTGWRPPFRTEIIGGVLVAREVR